jgi:hypothetical protein
VLYWQELDIAHKPGASAATRVIFENRHETEPVIVTSSFIFFAIDYYGTEQHQTPNTVKLYSPENTFSHFAGGPILRETDIVGPDLFDQPNIAIWVVDTTGFGSTPLTLPEEWHVTLQHSFPEIFTYQGEVIVTRYVRGRQ